MLIENVRMMKSAAAEGIQLSFPTTFQNESYSVGILLNFDCPKSATLLKSVIFLISILKFRIFYSNGAF